MARVKTLDIFDGIGNGGFARASATSTSTSEVAGIGNPVTWTFASSVELIETSTYTAVLRGADPSISFLTTINNSYLNGTVTFEFVTPFPAVDTLFRANYTLQPIPFEFSPALGLSVLGGLWGLGLVAKRIKKAKSKQKSD